MNQHQALTRVRRVIVATGVFAFVASAAVVWHDYRATRNTVEAELQGYARLTEAYFIAETRVAEAQLDQAAQLIERMDDPVAGMADETIWAHLRRIAAQAGGTDSIWLYGPNGQTLHNTLGVRNRIDSADREFIRGAAASGTPYLSASFIGRAQGKISRNVTRRVMGKDGRLKGFASVVLFGTRFDQHVRAIRSEGEHALFGVIREDGSSILRSPMLDHEVPPGSLRHLVEQFGEEGFYERTQSDGVNRLMAYRKVAEYPAFVAVGVSVESIHARWLRTTWPVLLLAAGWLLVIGVLSVSALRATRRAQHEACAKDAAIVARDEALRHKDLMFQEVHHRVKNNLQIVTNLLIMQSLRARPGDDFGELVQAANDRIHAIGLVHQQIYSQDDPTSVEFGPYLASLADQIAAATGLGETGIRIRVDAPHGQLGLDQALPAALVANEAVLNSIKHAFTGRTGGEIMVSYRQTGKTCGLVVADNGSGEAAARSGLGSQLMNSLARQLDGRLDIERGEGGTRVVLSFEAEPLEASPA